MRTDESAGPADPAGKPAAGRQDSTLTSSDDADLGAVVWSAIAQLDSRSRAVFLSVRFRRRSVGYTAAAMGLSSGEASRLLAQATRDVNARISRTQRRQAAATERREKRG